MRKPALTEAQQEVVRVAAATLRLRGRDKFLQALAVELARCSYPPSDADVKVAVRQLLGTTPLHDFAPREPEEVR
jgi:hypothetical protein